LYRDKYLTTASNLWSRSDSTGGHGLKRYEDMTVVTNKNMDLADMTK
jgi:hypothetical protein